MAPGQRNRKLIGQRRRIEDEGDDEGPEPLDMDDDSLTEGSVITEENDNAHDSDTSNVDEVSPTSANARKVSANGAAKKGGAKKKNTRTVDGVAAALAAKPAISDSDFMLNGLAISDPAKPVQEINFDDLDEQPTKPSAPIVVSSSSALQGAKRGSHADTLRREHEDYRKKRDEDPAFVPNRGAFFMHDHRGAGPSANGFRPFPRGGRGRGGRMGGIGGPFAPVNQMQGPSDPLTSSPWAHDMHEVVARSPAVRHPKHVPNAEGPPNGNGFIPTCQPNSQPINRTMSTERVLGKVKIRVFVPHMGEPKFFDQVEIKQYTKLPDHRPPLRRDKPVRISLPKHQPRYVFPAVDRSFIFIPREMRPNHQRSRGKPRSGLGSVSGFSRRTSIFGGSYYGGSMYEPSIAMSRRSSIVMDYGRDFISPTGSAMSRPPMPLDSGRPVVRLPPAPPVDQAGAQSQAEQLAGAGAMLASNVPQHPANQPGVPPYNGYSNSLPMHQPRPQKTVVVEKIESPTLAMHPAETPFQQAFHQQVPVHVANGFMPDSHHRKPSYPSHTTGTPLPQIPERAIHAAPFQPTNYPQHDYYGQPYPMLSQQQQYFYPPSFNSGLDAAANAPAFVPTSQPPVSSDFVPPNQGEAAAGQSGGPGQAQPIAQAHNGMVYYYDPAHLAPMPGYMQYPPAHGYAPGVMNMGGMVTPSPDGFFYPQTTQGMVYYPQ